MTILADSIIWNLANKGDLSTFTEKDGVTIAPDAENEKPAAKRETVARSTGRQPGEKGVYAEKLRNIIQKSRLCLHLDELDETPSNRDLDEPPTKLEKTIAAFMETFFYFSIPGSAVNMCFLAAKAERIRIGNETGFFPKLDCDFIAAQWFATVKASHEKSQSHRRLSTSASAFVNCPDCFGNSSKRKYIGGQLTNIICTHENFVDLGDD